MDVTISRSQYDALIAAGLASNTTEVLRLRNLIDRANGIIRYVLQIRWQDVGGKQPTRIELGLGWPPSLSFRLEQDRPIAREDVDLVLSTQAANPVDVMVTPDPQGIVGWTLIGSYDFGSGT